MTAVERTLVKSGPTDSLVNLVCRHVTSDKPSAIPVLLRILDMKYGKPAQPVEHAGKDGEPLSIEVVHIGSASNKAPA